MRLTGSRRITGTGDIYASSPTDRGITRNKEIANLLRAHPSFSFPVRDSRPTPSPSFDIVRAGWWSGGGGPGLRVISGFMGRDLPGSSGSVPDDGEKAVGPKI